MIHETIFIVPARAGSKGIPGKNKILVGGKPLILHTVEFALQFTNFGRVFVSTDDADIIELLNSFSDLVVDDRPKELASDVSKVAEVVRHLLLKYDIENCNAVLLQPTSPIRIYQDLANVIRLIQDEQSDRSVVSVVRVEDAHPARLYNWNGRYMESLQPELSNARRQDLTDVFLRNGSIYAFKVRNGNFEIITKQIVPYVMPPERSINLDSPVDLIVLRSLFNDLDFRSRWFS